MDQPQNIAELSELTEDEARTLLESLRWENGPICPHCGAEGAYRIKANAASKVRKGLLKCRACRKQFTVTVGTIFEDSHIPLRTWLLAIHFLCASKKGMSAHQLHRMLGVTYKSAWFMAHRIRYAMSQPPLVDKLRGVVEVDETYIGGKPRKGDVKNRQEAGRWSKDKPVVVALVERDGDVRSVDRRRVTAENLKQIVRDHVDPSAHVMTDAFPAYRGLHREFRGHGVVDHSKGEYRRGEAHTQTVEGYFSLLKRGINGVYHHVGEQHLHRYLSEFDFRYNRRKATDARRSAMTVRAAEGKRLKFRD